MVDQAGHNQVHSGSGQNDKDPGAHGGDHKQAYKSVKAAPAGGGKGADSRRNSRGNGYLGGKGKREILKIAQEPVSLETPIGEEEDSHLGDFIPDDDAAPAPAEAAAFSMLKEQLVDVLGTLTEREQKVLKLRFGLEDGRARTLEEVGKRFDVTRERIRQIEAKALRKLRHPTRSKKLKDYLE